MAKRVISGPLFQESWVELDEEVKAVEAAYHASAGRAGSDGAAPRVTAVSVGADGSQVSSSEL
jgi:hypothetical protein